jgi:hypothetical protein
VGKFCCFKNYLLKAMHLYYKLEGHTPVRVESLHEWGVYMESAQKQVAETIVGDARISTIFTGVDYGFGKKPLVFETTVFGGEHDSLLRRYSTWEEAAKGHDEIVIQVITTKPKFVQAV